MIRATIPDQQSLRSASKTLSSRMLRAASPSRSKGSKQSRPRQVAADVTGCNLPANTPKRAVWRLGASASPMSLFVRVHVAQAQGWVCYGVWQARLASGPFALAPVRVNCGARHRLTKLDHPWQAAQRAERRRGLRAQGLAAGERAGRRNEAPGAPHGGAGGAAGETTSGGLAGRPGRPHPAALGRDLLPRP